ncbi:MAG TPA: alkaline phosphatase family protein [Planctomycetota bacterium]|nr:alkaline phosphatase family protein [Planctomycetota bacterium]
MIRRTAVRPNTLRSAALLVVLGAFLVLPSVQAIPAPRGGHHASHVLLISVDGLHSIDLINWVNAHPGSALAELASHGYQYNNTSCSKPSDSFPGLMALITGGSPNATGIWYDVSYDRTYLPPGSAPGATPGTVTTYDESIDLVKNVPNYTGIGDPNHGIDLTALALNPANGNKPVLPWELLRVNTIFEVVHSHGRRTAWSDKHAAAYQIVKGPSGMGVDDYYSPEVTNSVLTGGGIDYTKAQVGPTGIQTNDELKVKAIVNECRGLDHSGTHHVGTPALFGMNFQAVSVGQKLAQDPNVPSLKGGYLDADGHPGPALDSALHFVDESLGDMVAALKAGGVYDDTTIIVTAKHGQSPIDLKKRIAADDSSYATALNSVSPGLGDGMALSDDTEALIWLPPGTQHLTGAAVAAIRANPNLNFEGGVPTGRPLITDILWGDSLKRLYNDPTKDSRTPDIIVIVTQGVIYTGGSKLAEHGGFNPDDTSVALLVSNPSLSQKVFRNPVQTFQVAPTILDILGLDPDALEAVRKEKTDELPGFDGKE